MLQELLLVPAAVDASSPVAGRVEASFSAAEIVVLALRFMCLSDESTA